MSYDLKANNKDLEDFGFGSFTWSSFLQDCCGTLFPIVLKGGQYYCVSSEDCKEMIVDDYPNILSCNGFEVSDVESKIIARMTRNYVAIQRSLDNNETWPKKIHQTTIDTLEEFAEWVENSEGFKIY